ncbi:MPPE1 Metallophosphoesterase, partial [Polyodon spathula]|nr:MPPE1 Metallophosphoesterase [Polyodon spathula]
MLPKFCGRGTFVIALIWSLTCVFLFCEFLIYYSAIFQCVWPDTVPQSNKGRESSAPVLRALFLADTHLLGAIRGHWFDKLRREWQMERAFQTAMWLLRPEIVFILGDVFDEGKWSSPKNWEDDVRRFRQMFRHPNDTELVVLVGNHDIGFHYEMNLFKLQRFEKVFNVTSARVVTKKGVNFVLVNSVALHGDGCYICQMVEKELIKISHALNCSIQLALMMILVGFVAGLGCLRFNLISFKFFLILTAIGCKNNRASQRLVKSDERTLPWFGKLSFNTSHSSSGPRQCEVSANWGSNERPFTEVSDAGYLSLSISFRVPVFRDHLPLRGGSTSHNPHICFRLLGPSALSVLLGPSALSSCRHRRPQSVTTFCILSSVAGSFAPGLVSASPPSHYPLYRVSDAECTGEDAAAPEEKNLVFKEQYDVLSQEASRKLLWWFRPRLILSGHTHSACEVLHRETFLEVSVPSFSWRNRNNPSFILGSISSLNFTLSKCFLPRESTVISIYCFASALLIILTLFYFQLLKGMLHCVSCLVSKHKSL